MDIIFITNRGKLIDVLGTENVNTIEKSMDKLEGGFYCYKKNITKHSTYILYDGEGNDKLDKNDKDFIIPLLQKLINNDFYIIYHTNQSQDFDEILAKIPTSRKFFGVHDLKDKESRYKYYKMLPEILIEVENNSYSALEKLVEELTTKINTDQTLEAKLNFLHKCLTPEEAKKATLNEKWKATEEFRKLKRAEDGPFGDKYLEALRSLRDKLLAS